MNPHEPIDRDREEILLADLRAALELTDPVPGRVLAAARAALRLREPGAAPIALIRDSDLQDGGRFPAGVRGGPRLLLFSTEGAGPRTGPRARPQTDSGAGSGADSGACSEAGQETDSGKEPEQPPGPRVEIEVTTIGPERQIVGRLEPPAPAHLTVRHSRGEQTTRVGAEGHFMLAGVPPGPISLLFRLPDATSVITSWVRI